MAVAVSVMAPDDEGSGRGQCSGEAEVARVDADARSRSPVRPLPADGHATGRACGMWNPALREHALSSTRRLGDTSVTAGEACKLPRLLPG